MSAPCPLQHRAGFSLIELLVAMTVLTLILIFCMSVTSHSTSLIGSHQELTGIQREGNAALDTIARHLARATLDTRLMHLNSDGTRMGDAAPGGAPQPWSGLMFVCGPEDSLGLSKDGPYAHALFFQASLGSDPALNPGDRLPYALNEVGYYLEVNDGAAPAFLADKPLRPRLMQLRRFPDAIRVRDNLDRFAAGGTVNLLEWAQSAVTEKTEVQPVASNIVALLITPRYLSQSSSEEGSISQLVPFSDYYYHSYATTGRLHRLPDAVEVTVVAAGEESIVRYLSRAPETPFDFGQETLFQNLAGSDEARATQARQNLATFLTRLDAEQIRHRVFSVTIRLKEVAP